LIITNIIFISYNNKSNIYFNCVHLNYKEIKEKSQVKLKNVKHC